MPVVLLSHLSNPRRQGALQGRQPTLRSTAGDSGVNLNRTQVVKRPHDVPDSARLNGQALAEFALVLIPLMLIFLGILQFGFIYGTQVGLTNAAREAARYAAASVTDTSTKAAANGTRVMAQLTSTMLPGNVQSYSAANLATTSGSPHTQVCYASYKDPSDKYSVRVTVDVEYRHPLFIPLIGAILDGLDGTTDGALRVGSQVQMTVGNGPLATDPGINVCTP